MATKAQIEANRRNAKKSTGPRSKEGKEKSAKNAQKHGLFSQKDVIAGENQADYDMLRMELIEEFKPIGPTGNILAERIVSLTWRLMRTERLQNLTLDSMIEKLSRGIFSPLVAWQKSQSPTAGSVLGSWLCGAVGTSPTQQKNRTQYGVWVRFGYEANATSQT